MSSDHTSAYGITQEMEQLCWQAVGRRFGVASMTTEDVLILISQPVVSHVVTPSVVYYVALPHRRVYFFLNSIFRRVYKIAKSDY